MKKFQKTFKIRIHRRVFKTWLLLYKERVTSLGMSKLKKRSRSCVVVYKVQVGQNLRAVFFYLPDKFAFAQFFNKGLIHNEGESFCRVSQVGKAEKLQKIRGKSFYSA